MRSCDGRLDSWRDSADTAGTQGGKGERTGHGCPIPCNVRGSNQPRHGIFSALPCIALYFHCVACMPWPWTIHHISSSRVAPFFSFFLSFAVWFLCNAVATCQIRPAPALLLLLLLLPVPLCFSWTRKNPAVATTNTINLFLPRPNPHAPDDKRDVTTASRRNLRYPVAARGARESPPRRNTRDATDAERANHPAQRNHGRPGDDVQRAGGPRQDDGRHDGEPRAPQARPGAGQFLDPCPLPEADL